MLLDLYCNRSKPRHIAALFSALAIAGLSASSAAAVPPGRLDCDYNEDDICDAADYVNWRNNYPKIGGAVFEEGDGNEDGKVDLADYLIWRSGFGSATPASGTETGLIDTATILAENAAPPGCEGDYNGDGICTDAADYVKWRYAMIHGGTLDNDPTQGVDKDDYDRWRSKFGNGSGPASASGMTLPASSSLQVPEPASLRSLIVAAAGGLARFRRLRTKP